MAVEGVCVSNGSSPVAGTAGVANTGAGGGGGGGTNAAEITGAGGGAGAKVRCMIPASLLPSVIYYTIGVGGTAGTAGTGGAAGGVGASGAIWIWEY